MKKFLALFMTFCMGMSSVAFAAAPSITKINAGEYKRMFDKINGLESWDLEKNSENEYL